MATVGFDIYQFKFAVRIPRIKLRRPKLLTRRKSPNKSGSSSKSDNERQQDVVTCSSKLTRKFETYNRSESVSSDPSFNSEEWIREFNARCKTLPQPRMRKAPEEAVSVVLTEDQEQTTFYANIPSSHSTPVSCKIVPLNRNEIEERKTLFLPDLSGVKIYESVELGSDGNEEGDSTTEEEDDYEVVTFKNNKLVPSLPSLPSTFPRPPRSLKSSCK